MVYLAYLNLNTLVCLAGFPGDPAVKNPPANAGDLRDAGSIPPLEEEMATHFSTLVWRIPRTEEPTVHRVAESQTH